MGRLKNVHISYNGVNPNEFHGLCDEDARKFLNIDPRDKVILFTGRFSGLEYRIEVLLEAFAIVQEKIPHSLLILVGDRPPRALQRDSVINSKKMRIIRPVTRSEIKKYLAAADVCIGPSGSTRAIPLKVLEYMVCGKPVVSGLNSVSREVAVDGFNCICTLPEPQAVAKAILNVLQNEDYGRMLGSNAKRTAVRFTWDEIARDLEKALLEVINHQHR